MADWHVGHVAFDQFARHVLEHPSRDAMILVNTAERGRAELDRMLSFALSNARFRELHPEPIRQYDNRLCMAAGGTIVAIFTTRQIRGMRPDAVFCPDVLEDLELVHYSARL